MQTMTPQAQNLKIQKWVALVSAALLVIKFLAYFLTASVAILTDAMESIVNVIAGLVGLYSLYIVAQPRDFNHPYGHGKAEFLSAATEGILIGLAGLFILYKAIHKLIVPTQVREIDLGIALVAITAIVNYALGRACVRYGRKNNSLALQASGKHLQTDTYSTLAVIVGLALLHITHFGWIDSVVALLLSLFILYTSYNIIRKSVAGMMDEADENLLTDMIALINNRRRHNWVDLHNLRVIQFGSILHVDAHLTVPWYFTVREAHEEIDILSDLIKNKYGPSLELFIHSDGCITGLQCPICLKADCAVRQQPFAQAITWTLENVVDNQKHDTRLSKTGNL